MPSVRGDKVQLCVMIPESLNKQFRRFLADKYGGVSKGQLSDEVVKAIQAWISAHTQNAQGAGIRSPNPLPRWRKVYDEIKAWLARKLGIPPTELNEVLAKDFIEAIMAVRGKDKRTIKGWLETFERQGLIKWITPKVIELVR